MGGDWSWGSPAPFDLHVGAGLIDANSDTAEVFVLVTCSALRDTAIELTVDPVGGATASRSGSRQIRMSSFAWGERFICAGRGPKDGLRVRMRAYSAKGYEECLYDLRFPRKRHATSKLEPRQVHHEIVDGPRRYRVGGMGLVPIERSEGFTAHDLTEHGTPVAGERVASVLGWADSSRGSGWFTYTATIDRHGRLLGVRMAPSRYESDGPLAAELKYLLLAARWRPARYQGKAVPGEYTSLVRVTPLR